MADENNSFYVEDEEIYNKTVEPIPKPEVNIGIDINDTLLDNIIEVGSVSKIDMGEIESFTRISQNRDQLYSLLDTMADDSLISSVLETYAEDATEMNDQGRIVWVDSPDDRVAKFVTYLLDTMNIDKHIYGWVYSLIKYGDLYLRLYRQSEYEDAIFGKDKREKLNEDVNIKMYHDNDNYVHYVEAVPNPAEVFELTKFGKTFGFIKTKINPTTYANFDENNQAYNIFKYKFKKNDIDIYSATEFVHACLDDNSTRTPEEVNIFLDDKSMESGNGYGYNVRRGQSILYNTYKIWRELMLLQNSVLLNRITKSGVVRVTGVEVGDMPKEQVKTHLLRIKQLFEQKAAIYQNTSMYEYTNPGPLENNVYVPTHNGIGNISIQTVGGDVDVKGLADLDYFKNLLFGNLRVPKQYFGDTDDNAGFSGGQSLSIISSRYAKAIKRIQSTVIQAITDLINLMLIDKGLNSYINKFSIKMLPPTTQEEIDRRESTSSKIGVVQDIMNILGGEINDQENKLKILKSLMSDILTDSEVISILQDEIDELEEGQSAEIEDMSDNEPLDIDIDVNDNGRGTDTYSAETQSFNTANEINNEQNIETPDEVNDINLPSPQELGIDMTDSNASELG